ncbi:MAG TPA: HAMP domain-containing histidine kinase [Desulfobacteraceae bacterium]|nr:HAMP domain-containing histidine kinase [Desulfobacteraceae bacterium]
MSLTIKTEEELLTHDLDQALKLLKKKEQDYTAYKFTSRESMAIFAFFDLAQEFATLNDLYRIAVAVIKFFFKYESCIYTIRSEDSTLLLHCCSSEGLLDPPEPARENVTVHNSPYRAGFSYVFPIIGKKILADKIPPFLDNQILGMLEIYPVKKMGDHQFLFFQKYANRIGYNMHNKLVLEQNVDHIRFINQLVSDIEHNVITPNLYYKAFLINMKKNLNKNLSQLENINSILPELELRNNSLKEKTNQAINNLYSIHQDMDKKMADFESHFRHLSLFIETLFRGEHFKTGSYVLKRRSYNILNDIFLPELEHYRKRLNSRGIDIIEPQHLPSDNDLTIFIDLGLTAQVFANLLSNALKYCQPALDKNGNYQKYISYAIDIVSEKAYEIQDGIKFSLFSTGESFSKKEATLIFEEGYKIPKDKVKSGSGHGLHFVYNIVQLHGGYVGCTPQENGNEFYIVLPRKK